MARFRIEVNYRKGVENPEAVTVLRNLKILGFEDVTDVHVSRIFELDIKGSREVAEKTAREISERILSNPVIQEYRILG
ncbi:MAG: phosphoribosylformylglycinamidine synthase subunit PurS [Candidatus Thermoplasmatota archaeon]|nr:phosphoribosylformylglycinamidine synthase subunit PurS [Candidatus Thermoplasmatota archaeon]MCL5730682.1 phosphoribosylformylglycinamidine synthase subunit PurS [Candidatus Thermoplasmatota archaeon]